MAIDWNRPVIGKATTKQVAIGGAVLAVLYFEYRRRKAARAGSGSDGGAGGPALDTGTYEAGYGAGYGSGLGAGGGAGGGVAPTGDGGGAPAPTGQPAPTTGGISSTGAGPAVGPAANRYSLGQVVNASSGEHIVSQAFSPLYGWLNVTNLGGVYTGGGGQPGQSISRLPFGGSYLGYVAQRFGVGTPGAQQEQRLHGAFGSNAITINPNGGYTLINTRGERYNE